jgi:type IV secretory pathway TrbD component
MRGTVKRYLLIAGTFIGAVGATLGFVGTHSWIAAAFAVALWLALVGVLVRCG